MKKIVSLFLGGILLLSLSACSNSKQGLDNLDSIQVDISGSETTTAEPEENAAESEESTFESGEDTSANMHIQVRGREGQHIVFQLNESPAAQTLYEQLPLSIQVEDYSHNEKIFYPPKDLDTNNTPLAKGPEGTLAYYAPWGNVVLYYGDCGGASGLYELGEVVSDTEQIETLSGEIQIEVVTVD